MVRVTGLYRWRQGAHFDHDRYRTEHMPAARDLLLPHGLRRLESDQCMVGPEPAEGTVIAATHAYFDTPQAAWAALAAVSAQLLASVPTYSSDPPEIMVSVVTIHA